MQESSSVKNGIGLCITLVEQTITVVPGEPEPGLEGPRTSATNDLSLTDTLADYLNHLRARRRAERTEALYRTAVCRLDELLRTKDREPTVAGVGARDMRDYHV